MIINRFCAFWRVLASATLIAIAAQAGATESPAAAELKTLLQSADSLQGRFEQRLFDRDGHELQKTEGKFVVQRPGSFYWETSPPFEQVIVGNAGKLWVYDPDLEQVTVHRQDQDQQVSPAQLLSGELEHLEEQYSITSEGDGDTTRFTLVSQDRNGLFARLRLEYQGAELSALQFEDNMGQVTDLTFTEMEINPEIDPAVFQFDIPEGVDVIVDD